MHLNTYEWAGVGIIAFLFVLTVVSLQMSNNINVFSTLSAGQSAALVTSVDSANQANNSSEQRLIVNDIARGTGKQVREGDRVVVHYTGSLSTGEQFDNSRDRGQPLSFTVGAGRVIAGWEKGILGMRQGGTRVLVIPPELAYGSRAVSGIPANSTLVFTIELLEVE